MIVQVKLWGTIPFGNMKHRHDNFCTYVTRFNIPYTVFHEFKWSVIERTVYLWDRPVYEVGSGW
jgi:hypothetical protein